MEVVYKGPGLHGSEGTNKLHEDVDQMTACTNSLMGGPCDPIAEEKAKDWFIDGSAHYADTTLKWRAVILQYFTTPFTKNPERHQQGDLSTVGKLQADILVIYFVWKEK